MHLLTKSTLRCGPKKLIQTFTQTFRSRKSTQRTAVRPKHLTSNNNKQGRCIRHLLCMPPPTPPLLSVGMLSMWQHCGSGFTTQSHSCDAIKNAHGHSTWFYILPRELVESERAKLEGYKSAHRRFSPSPQTTHPNHLLFCQKPSCYLCCMYLLPCRLLPQGCYPVVIVVVAVSDFLTLAATMSRASTSIPCSSFFIAIPLFFFCWCFRGTSTSQTSW